MEEANLSFHLKTMYFGKDKVLKASFLFWNNTISFAKQKIAENIII